MPTTSSLLQSLINVCISHVIITLIRYFLIPKSRDLVSHNPGISGLKNGPGSRDPGIRDPGIAIPNSLPVPVDGSVVCSRPYVSRLQLVEYQPCAD